MPVLEACQIFDPTNWPLDGTDSSYGKEKIAVLVDHYIHLLAEGQGKTVGQIKCKDYDEWEELLVLTRRRKASTYMHVAEATILARQRFPILSKLVQLIAMLPMSTAECERGFLLRG